MKSTAAQKLNDAGAREQAAQAAGFAKDNRKIDAALVSAAEKSLIDGIGFTKDPGEDSGSMSPPRDALVKLKDAGFKAQSDVSGGFITGECGRNAATGTSPS